MYQEKTKIEYPETIVGALIINGERKILLGKSKKWNGKFAVFGGHIELGERSEDAVRREVKEEAGLDVEVITQLDFAESIFEKEFKGDRHFIFLDFLCRYEGEDDAVKLNGEFENEYKWVTPEEGLKMNIMNGTRSLIERYLKWKEREEYLAGWKRCMADFENYKKRQTEMQKDLARYGIENIILEFLPVVDNFYASTDHIPEDQKDGSWVQGIMYIQKQLENVLNQNGVTEIAVAVGDEFDPTIHEAVSKNEETTKEKSSNKIEKILQRGYKMGDKVIRPARVIVN